VKLPVEPERLRSRFPSLSDEDLEAYASVTRTLLAEPAARGRRLAQIMAAASRAQEKEAASLELAPEEALALRYLRALDKMQGR
jgi:hypothetical protein